MSQSLRESVVFAPHNLMRDSPFTKLDLISCRNLLIDFHPNAQKTVLTLFHFGLKTGGYLFLGPSESPGDLAAEFDTVDPHVKIYRKRRDIGLPADLRLPLPRAGINGLTGAELIERIRPDVAIVDLGLPVMSGFDVAKRLRTNPLTRDQRLIAWSGYGQDADVQAALDAGFDDHLTKPSDPDRLEQVLARAQAR